MIKWLESNVATVIICLILLIVEGVFIKLANGPFSFLFGKIKKREKRSKEEMT